jgi:hypothetical protein
MKPLSRRSSGILFAVFVLLMVGTRFGHFGTAIHLPDASMAVFFIGGLYLGLDGWRRHAGFAFFVLLAVALDWASISYAGVSDFCVTAAYAFLPLAYAVLWYAGSWYAKRVDGRLPSLLGALAVAVVAASLSFAISNGSFYWLGGRYANPHVAEYLSRLAQWGPLFVRTTTFYVATALAIHGLLAWAANARAAHRADA